MSRLLVTGCSSRIYQGLAQVLPEWIEAVPLPREDCDMSLQRDIDAKATLIRSCDYFVLLHGTLSSQEFLTRSEQDVLDSISVNVMSVVRICELALQSNPRARILVMGSESGRKGSYDIPYWLAKSALHSYVRERRLAHPLQQLVCLAPSMVLETRMTESKPPALVQAAEQQTPKLRGLSVPEVCQAIHHLLFVDQGYTTNTVIEINGGKFARQSQGGSIDDSAT